MQVGALDPQRDFLDVRDVCHAYALCLLRAEAIPPGSVLNVASGTPRRVGAVLDGLLDAAGLRDGERKVRVETDAARLRPSDIMLAVGDARRIETLLGWRPRIAWEQTLRDVLADWRRRVAEQPDA
jgi:nucleoside-diphosphate-sugar epimerase